ncbi:cell division protein FtsX [Marinisporobacter balticus]|uniref:Cell division protein FtsX n=1 Tax=Marinisporobacter balticus TaxID=2018667 RepID=A0A4R2KZZ9_9FIRM|nr:permease-like cell division protein FtsX [Marinisporobacter balticus]TCO79533.1 cell division protein FtsX [Marinisporobacter balticus]
MKNIIYNMGYFLKEAKTIIQLNLLSNVFSVLSTGLIFFILAMVISGWWASSHVVELIKDEAEISVYYNEELDNDRILELIKNIKAIHGVQKVRSVDAIEAYHRMEEIMGKDAKVLEIFDDNPFSPFIEAQINLEEMNLVLEKLHEIQDIDHVRDNRAVLDRLKSISSIVKFLGTLVVTAVGISTLVITAHIIRQGVYSNREQINTLRLLGAPEGFIVLPFLLEGLLLTLGGGVLAAALAVFTLNNVYGQVVGQLPFIPLPAREVLVSGIIVLMLLISITLGILGSLFGLLTARSNCV